METKFFSVNSYVICDERPPPYGMAIVLSLFKE